jgi:two-component system nitrate/nitrite response regulator NarL
MNILIADDHDLFRDMLVQFIENEGGFQSVAVGTFEEAIARIETDDPFDLILLDYNMPGMDHLNGLKAAIEFGDGQRVALISGEANQKIAEDALNAGAAGFIPKSLPAKSLINVLKFMVMGEQYAPVNFMAAIHEIPENSLVGKLKERELQVLKGLAEGKSNKGIARDLEIKIPTVKMYTKTLYRKIGAQNRTQAALIAQKANIF